MELMCGCACVRSCCAVRSRWRRQDYCHIVTPPDLWGVELRTRIYLGHYHEFHYVSCRPI